MWPTTPGWAEALTGDIALDVRGAVWLGGTVTIDDLEILDGTLKQTLTGGQIQTSVDLAVADPDGTMFNAQATDPLGVLGHRVRLSSVVSAGRWEESAPVGTLRVDRVSVDSASPWRLYPATGKWVRGPQTLRVSLSDMLTQVADERFLAPVSVRPGATIASEIRRLTAGIVPVGDTMLDLTGTVPASVVYDEKDRLGSLMQLWRVAGVVPWVDRQGVLQGIPDTGSGEVWPVPADAIITAAPSSDRAELRNGWAVTSETESRESLRGQALEDTGPLEWGGPFGRVPAFAQYPILRSNAACRRAAVTLRRKALATRTQIVTVDCGTDPALDVLDTAHIALPDRSVTGPVVAIQRPLLGRSMQVSVSVDWEGIQ